MIILKKRKSAQKQKMIGMKDNLQRIEKPKPVSYNSIEGAIQSLKSRHRASCKSTGRSVMCEGYHSPKKGCTGQISQFYEGIECGSQNLTGILAVHNRKES